MTDIVIRLDKSKPYSECRGERTPDDPHYRVHFWQGGKVGTKIILLPFDALGVLIQPDPAKAAAYEGVNSDGKPVMYQPLYNKDMLDYLDRKNKKFAAPAAAAEAGEPVAADDETELSTEDDVNFVSWLRGEAQYQPHELRKAYKARYSKNTTKIGDMVIELVLDEKVVPEDEVCAELAKLLPAKAA